MDLSDRKCCEDFCLGNKKSSGFYFKMCAQLILKLSVFSLFCVFLKEETVLQVASVSRFLKVAGPEHVTDRIGGFYLYIVTIPEAHLQLSLIHI